ncbi:MAG: polysaccharide deacetylase family protein [Lawsonibacter sp.]|nr:polysaccharide deacetylase family protein [Lawsonibacter sp.]
MRGTKWLALAGALILLAALSAPAPSLPADAPAEVELDGRPLVALTFDDGPRSSTTGPLLEGLALREVPATFFLVGSRVAGNEELVRRMAQEGHQIGVHTFDHVELKGLTRREFDLQVGKTRAALANLLGDGEFWLRPPYGIFDRPAAQWADSPLVLWSVDPEDWRDSDIDRVVASVTEHVQDGDIILLHDLYPSSASAALRIVDRLQERGFSFVTVEQLMELRGRPAEKGKVVRCVPPCQSP